MTADRSLIPAIEAHLPPGWRPAHSSEADFHYSVRRDAPSADPSAVSPTVSLYSNDQCVLDSVREADALEHLEARVRIDVARTAHSWVFVHAGVVEWQGRAIVMPGDSGFGKSTLVAALVRAGATYYSDEYAAIDERGWVHPYARRLTLRDAYGASTRLRVDELGGASGTTAIPIGLVVLTRYEEGQIWTPTPATSGDAVLALLGHAIRARLAPSFILPALARAVAGVSIITSPRGEAADAARALLDHIQPLNRRGHDETTGA